VLRKVASSIVLALVLLALTAGVASAAGNATQDAYGGLLGQQSSSGPTAKQSGASLPFTGFDVAIVALLGVGLVGTGLVVRRTVRSNQS
jgi:hypothetical protein